MTMTKSLFSLVSFVGAAWLVAACSPSPETGTADGLPSVPAGDVALWPALVSSVPLDQDIEAKIDALLERMTIEEKVGQILQPEIGHVTPDDVRNYHLGSVLNGGGSTPHNNKYASIQDWVAMADGFYNASVDTSDGRVAIPIMWGTDAVHGLGNVIGATLFPHNIGLGATGNPDLLEAIGWATAREIAVTGLDWNFSPTVAVARDQRWGRTYEAYSEDPEMVRAFAGRMVEGLQGKGGSEGFLDEYRVVATAKHFIGDGGTELGIDRGDTNVSEEELRDIHGPGYFSSIEAGVQVIMASFTTWNGERLHGHEYLLTNVLKEQMGFDGPVLGDWSGHGFIPGCTALDCPQAINAGLDIYMVPEPNWKELFYNLVAQVEDGSVPKARLDDAVRRFLRVKFRAGLFERGAPSTRALAGREDVLGAEEHREIARQAVRESLVMLKNRDNLLPLKRDITVLVAGDGAHDIGKQSGGWTISWQGTGNANEDFPGATSIYEGISAVVDAAGGTAILSEDGSFSDKPDVAIVVFGEDPYAEMQGDITHLSYSDVDDSDLQLLRGLREQGVPVVSLFITGRPLWVNPEINASDAFVVAWLPGTEGQGIADVLFRDAEGEVNHDMVGRLTFTWPRIPEQVPLNRGDQPYEPLFPYGYGLSYADEDTLDDNLFEEGLTVAAVEERLVVFQRRPLSPFALEVLGRINDREVVTSNVVSVSTVTISAVDRREQHDARQVVWSGEGQGLVALFSSQRLNLLEYLSSDSVLTFDVKVDAAPSDTTWLRLGCGSYCAADIDFTEHLAKLAGEGWQTVSVALDCFPDSGENLGVISSPEAYFAHVVQPFALVTEGSLDLTFSDVVIQKGASDDSLACPGGEAGS